MEVYDNPTRRLIANHADADHYKLTNAAQGNEIIYHKITHAVKYRIKSPESHESSKIISSLKLYKFHILGKTLQSHQCKMHRSRKEIHRSSTKYNAESEKPRITNAESKKTTPKSV